MKPSDAIVAEPEGHPNRASLVAELRRLEQALQRTQGQLAALGGEALPGLHLVLETSGGRALLPIARVREIVRLVATEPLPGAPRPVLGSFVCRGAPVIAVDLAAGLGEAHEPPLDAQMVILAGAPAIALVVDRVRGLVDSPRLHVGDAGASLPDGWRGSRLVAGLCVEGGAVVPLLDPSPLAEAVREWTA
jgi:purine-binding chemotaxis protein CheW